jgi:hypothetical protein
VANLQIDNELKEIEKEYARREKEANISNLESIADYNRNIKRLLMQLICKVKSMKIQCMA